MAASLHGRRGIVKITPDRQASLAVSGQNLVGLAFAPGKSAVLATNSGVHRLAWGIAGPPHHSRSLGKLSGSFRGARLNG